MTILKEKSKITRAQVCKALAKVSAYLRVGNINKAREWAEILVEYLVKMDVYPTHVRGVWKKED